MGVNQRYDLLLHALDESIWSLEPSAKSGERRDSQKLAAEFVRADSFDRVAANLSEQWTADGFAAAVGSWDTLSAERQIGYLADFAGAFRVPFERFEAAARQTLGMAPKQEFSPDDEWYLRQQFGEGQKQIGRIRADKRERSRSDARMADQEIHVDDYKQSDGGNDRKTLIREADDASRREGNRREGVSTAGPQHPWPSEIASANRQKQTGQDHSHNNGRDKNNGHDDGHSL